MSLIGDSFSSHLLMHSGGSGRRGNDGACFSGLGGYHFPCRLGSGPFKLPLQLIHSLSWFRFAFSQGPRSEGLPHKFFPRSRSGFVITWALFKQYSQILLLLHFYFYLIYSIAPSILGALSLPVLLFQSRHCSRSLSLTFILRSPLRDTTKQNNLTRDSFHDRHLKPIATPIPTQ